MIQIYMIPEEFVDKYNLKEKAHKVYIFLWVVKGVNGIPQEGRIAHGDLVKQLEPYECPPSRKTP